MCAIPSGLIRLPGLSHAVLTENNWKSHLWFTKSLRPVAHEVNLYSRFICTCTAVQFDAWCDAGTLHLLFTFTLGSFCRENTTFELSENANLSLPRHMNIFSLPQSACVILPVYQRVAYFETINCFSFIPKCTKRFGINIYICLYKKRLQFGFL